jgi:hypothetical protein
MPTAIAINTRAMGATAMAYELVEQLDGAVPEPV